MGAWTGDGNGKADISVYKWKCSLNTAGRTLWGQKCHQETKACSTARIPNEREAISDLIWMFWKFTQTKTLVFFCLWRYCWNLLTTEHSLNVVEQPLFHCASRCSSVHQQYSPMPGLQFDMFSNPKTIFNVNENLARGWRNIYSRVFAGLHDIDMHDITFLLLCPALPMGHSGPLKCSWG